MGGQHRALFERLALRLRDERAASDDLLVLRWQVLRLCQHLLGEEGTSQPKLVAALATFAELGPAPEAVRAVEGVLQSIPPGERVMPAIAERKRAEVHGRLAAFEALGAPIIEQAIRAAPDAHARLRAPLAGALIAGIRHRLSLATDIVVNPSLPERARVRAASAILYLADLHDAIPDDLGEIGLLDDDFALRIVLDDLAEHLSGGALHWSERITKLWDDVPFLRGVRLRTTEGPVEATWMDRVSSYFAYTHTLNGRREPLLLLQPSVACSPLHSLIGLIGLLVLDGVTSAKDAASQLRPGQYYEIDGRLLVQYLGPAPDPQGWIVLNLRDLRRIVQPVVAKRMVPVSTGRLSKDSEFQAYHPRREVDLMRRFFGWGEDIGAASVPGCVVFVSSRGRAERMFASVESNGVRLLEDRLVRFSGAFPSIEDSAAGLVLVVPTLLVARQLVTQGLDVQAIVVDGFDRLNRGRDELPFFQAGRDALPLIVWSPAGYTPLDTPPWLAGHKRMEVPREQLPLLLELEGPGEMPDRSAGASLWEAATHAEVTQSSVPRSQAEVAIVAHIDTFMTVVRECTNLPVFLLYRFTSTASSLRCLVASTPAHWSEIQESAARLRTEFEAFWDNLSPRAKRDANAVHLAYQSMFASLIPFANGINSKGEALLSLLPTLPDEPWVLVFDRPESVMVATRFLHRSGYRRHRAIQLRDLGVCDACVVVGCTSMGFGRRLLAHTPRRVVALSDEEDSRTWARIERAERVRHAESMLEALGHRPPKPAHVEARLLREDADELVQPRLLREDVAELVPCVFIWTGDDALVKVLSHDARVPVLAGDLAKNRMASQLAIGDRVILNLGNGPWSPDEELTQALVRAVEESEPDMVAAARSWRRSLRALRESRRWTTEELLRELARVGVSRDLQTLEGWLQVERAAPIGPRGGRAVLQAILQLSAEVADWRLDEVASACASLRDLHAAAGRAILQAWGGRTVNPALNSTLVESLVDQMRHQVHAFEVEGVSRGLISAAMIGMWVPPEWAEDASGSDRESPV
ncbi:MAG: hypothetical protein L6Q35_03810 [Phycisphaerales bacterium]|nr:hypothetical protein [Phycisphaerales bacterium]